MVYKIKILTLIFLLVLISKISILANENPYSGDFSSRSLILRSISGEDRLDQEKKDILKAKKLLPTPQCLIEQVKKNHYENVELLLQTNVNPNIAYMADYPIYIAAKNNNFEMVKLLHEYGAKLDRGFYSELYIAVKNKNKSMAQFLIDNSAKVNYRDSITNETILYYALKNNMKDITEQLINKGANIDIKSAKLIKKKKMTYLLEEKIWAK